MLNKLKSCRSEFPEKLTPKDIADFTALKWTQMALQERQQYYEMARKHKQRRLSELAQLPMEKKLSDLTVREIVQVFNAM